MRPVDVLTELDIDRPVDLVAAYAADPDRAPIWYDDIESVEWRTDRPLRVGTVVGFVARFLGRRLAYAGTRMTLRNRGTPTGFSALAALVMAPAMRRATAWTSGR